MHVRADRRVILAPLAPTVEQAEAEYAERAANASLIDMNAGAYVPAAIDPTHLVALYSNTLVGSKTCPRQIYDELRSGAPGGLCPLCGQRTVGTLDHYLEKVTSPIFAVAPLNLVPACFDCNKNKSEHAVENPEDQTLHPYFDHADSDIWLNATVVEDHPTAVVFAANPPAAWHPLKRQRVISHFHALKLGSLYAAHAAAELAGMRQLFTRVADSGGPPGLREFLLEEAQSRRAAVVNSWQGSLFACLGASEWFCQEGYQHIAQPN